MGKYGFTMNVLMELAGLLYFVMKDNGGDGIVAARHLKMFGLNPELFIVKRPKSEFFEKLIQTCTVNNIPIFDHDELSKELEASKMTLKDKITKNYQLVVDAMFGFSFKPPIRTPFDSIINTLTELKQVPVYSVDIPSGWDVEKGNTNYGLVPNYLISLTLPKTGVKEFKGKHFLGGRFIPEQMIKEQKLQIPIYPGIDTFIELD